jgi:gas vesicle protein
MNKILSSQEVKTIIIQDLTNASSFGEDACNRMIKVINGYGKREGFYDKIGGIFYRIWNAVKAIFGQSDWQVARKTLTKEFLEQDGELDKKLPEELRKKKLKIMRDSAVEIIAPTINVFVEITYLKGHSSQEIRVKFKKLTSDILTKIMEPHKERMRKFDDECNEYMRTLVPKKEDL